MIPYFYGGDSHVVLIELWVDEPGAVADVTVRYKDMVALDNATARASVSLGRLPRAPTPMQLAVRQHVRGFIRAEHLQRAAHRVERGDSSGALQWFQRSRAMDLPSAEDRRMLSQFEQLIRRTNLSYPAERAVVADALLLAAERKVGEPGE